MYAILVNKNAAKVEASEATASSPVGGAYSDHHVLTRRVFSTYDLRASESISQRRKCVP